MSHNLIVAIDIGSLTNSVNLMDHNGNSLYELKKLSNNLPGISNLWKVATTLLKEYNLDGIDFVMESSGPYWFGSYWWLKNQCSTLQSSSVTALNSQIVSGFKGKFSHKKQKNDQKDAKTIGDRFRFGNFDPVYVPQGDVLALRFLTRYRLSLVQKLVASKGFFLGYLFFKMNEYSRYSRKGNKQKQKLFSNTFGAASTALITKYPSAEDLAAAPLDELISLIKDASRGLIKDASEKATFAHKIAHDSYPLPEELKEPIHFILQETLSLIEFLQKQIQQIPQLNHKKLRLNALITLIQFLKAEKVQRKKHGIMEHKNNIFPALTIHHTLEFLVYLKPFQSFLNENNCLVLQKNY